MRNILMLAVALALTATLHAADAVPLGHPDFYPLPERPLGWRGDGTGAWPGAKCVTNWNSETGENIVWKTNTPGAGLCQPIVVGEKVFITADPNWLVCYNVHNGKLLWQTPIDHTLCMKEEDRIAARAEQAFFDEQWKAYANWRYKLQKLEMALEKAQSGKKSEGDLLYASGKIPTLPLQITPGNYDGTHEPFPERHKKILALLENDLASKDLYLALQDEAIKNGWIKQKTDNSRLLITASWPLLKRYQAAHEKWNLWSSLGNNWQGYTSFNFATPVTDGKYIYVTTCNNAVAAVDFSGKISWIIWEFRPGRGCFGGQTAGMMHTQYVPSPALMDGKLVVNNMGLLRAYDVASGKKIWEVWGPSEVAKGEKPSGYYYRGSGIEAASPVVGYLPLPDGGRLGVVCLADGNVWRLDDGKLLCKDSPKSANGGVVLHRESGIVLGNKVVRLKAKSRDEVVAEPLWEGAFIKFCAQPMIGDRFISKVKDGGKRSNLAAAYDVRTGEANWTSKDAVCNYGDEYSSPIVVGRHLVAFASNTGRGYAVAANLSANNTGIMSCAVSDLDTGETHRIANGVIDRRFAGEGEFAVLNKTVGWGYQQNASPSAQANRIFFRCRGVLWCIGDPKQPFPVPKDCPPEARVKP